MRSATLHQKILRSLSVASVLLVLSPSVAFAASTITPATGGSAISSTTAGGSYTALTGPVITENAVGEIGGTSMTLNVPTGFVFKTTASSVTATITNGACSGGGNKPVKVGTGGGSSTQSVTPTTTAITIDIKQSSTGVAGCKATLTFTGIEVRPTAASPLATGNITLTGTVSGVTGTTNFGTLTEVDSTAPVLQTFTSTTSNGTYGPGSNINVTATYDEALAGTSTMTLTLDNGASVVLSTVVGSTVSGTYTVGATGSAQDSADLTVASITSESVLDGSSNTRTNSAVPASGSNIAGTSAIVIDTTAPATTGTPNMQVASDTGTSSSDDLTSDTTPTFDVSCVSGTTVQLYADASATGSSGTCSSSTVALTAGTQTETAHSITAKQTDPAGNVSAASSGLSITIDASAPSAPGTPNMKAASDTGTFSTDDLTSNTTPSFDVSCVDGTSVQLYSDTVATGSAGTCSSSTVTLTAGTLTEAIHSMTAVQTDPAGNPSLASTGLSVEIDISAPGATGTPNLDVASDTGASSTDDITSDTTPTFTISCTDGSVVQLYSDTFATGASATCSSSTASLTASTLSEAIHSITAKQTDLAGNESLASLGLSVTIDISVPAAPGIPDLVVGSDTGTSSTDDLTNDTTPTFAVSCEDGATVQLYSDASATGSAGTCSSSTVTLTAGVLSEAVHSITAKQTDPASNESPASSGLSITIDASAPAATGAPDLDAASDTGISSTDDFTADTTPTFTISCVSGTTVQLYADASATGSIGTCSSSTVSLTAGTLSEAVHAMTAKQTDDAGNQSLAPSTLNITVSTSVPVTVTPATGGSSISDTTVGGTFTSLTGPVITENAAGQIGGANSTDITLNVASGFEFDTSALSVTATVTNGSCSGGGNKPIKVGPGGGSSSQTVTPTSSAITIHIKQISTGSAGCWGTLTFSGIKVRPTAVLPLANANMTLSGDPVTGVTGSTNFGTLAETSAPTVAPTLQSFTSTTSDGTYGPGSDINVTATYDESLGGASTMTVVLDNGVAVVLSTVSGNTVSGTYTVGTLGSGQDSVDLTVASITSESVVNTGSDTTTTSTVPVAPNNIADTSAIIIDTTNSSLSVTVTPATGGSSISDTTVGGTFTDLTGPVVAENEVGQIATNNSDITLNIPTGFEFDTSSNVTATVTNGSCTGGGNKSLLLGPGGGSDTQIVTPISSAITIHIKRASTGDSTCQATLTFTNIKVRPTAALPLASGDLAFSGAPVTGVTGSTNFGTLTETAAPLVAPTLQSFTSTTADGTYGPGSNVNITATYDVTLGGASTMTVTLDNGVSVVLSTVSTNKVSGTYTVGTLGSGEDTSDLTVTSITSESVVNTGSDTTTTSTVPAAPNNIADTSDIIIDTTNPSLSVTVTPAVGGSLISVTTVGGTFTTLTGPIIQENEVGQIGSNNADITLDIPTGFEFDTTSDVTATVANDVCTGGGNKPLQLGTIGSDTQIVTPTSSAITIHIKQASAGDAVCAGTLTFSGIKVRPTAADPLASGNLTLSGDPVTGVTGSTNFGTLTEVLATSTTSTVLSATNPSVVGDTVTFTANVSGSFGPTGTVDFKDGSTIIGSGLLDGDGNASFETDELSVGSHDITAAYEGDDNNDTSTSPEVTVQIVQKQTAVTLFSPIVSPQKFPAPVTMFITVSGYSPTGIITFKDGDDTLGSVALDDGSAQFPTLLTTIATHTLTAEYSGDPNNEAGTSNAVVIDVVDPSTLEAGPEGGLGTETPTSGSAPGSSTRGAANIVSFVARLHGLGVVPPAAFGGGDVPLNDQEKKFLCSIQRSLPHTAKPGFIDALATMMANFLGRDASVISAALTDHSQCSGVAIGLHMVPVVAQATFMPFPVDSKGFPVSGYATWNACIRGTATIKDIWSNTDRNKNNVPRSCADYHTQSVWHHPDLNMFFTFDKKTRSIGLPGNYVQTPIAKLALR